MDWQIFFIGPMGVEPDPRDPQRSIDYRSHLPRLHAHVVQTLSRHGFSRTGEDGFTLTRGRRVNSVTLSDGTDRISVLTPFDLFGSGDIPDDVFDAIDDADLIVADLSGNKPAVVYELAFAHALGIETILVGRPREQSFYLRQMRQIELDFDRPDSSFAALDPALGAWLADRHQRRYHASNPLQQFYGAPLPDISAANGLAAGFYDNFARPILLDGRLIYRDRGPDGTTRDSERELRGLLVLRPPDLQATIEQLRVELEARLEAEFPGEVRRGGRDSAFVMTSEKERTTFFVVRDCVLDIPRTMFSLPMSPRLRRMVRQGATTDRMEGVLIGRFFEGVRQFLREEHSLKNRRHLFEVGSVDELIARLRREPRESR